METRKRNRAFLGILLFLFGGGSVLEAQMGYGIEMIGTLGNTDQVRRDWQRQQHYVGPVFSYAVSKNWTVHVEPTIGLSDVSDPFVLRMGVGYSIDYLLHRRPPTP